MSRIDWYDRARCAGTEDNRFVPDSANSERKLCAELDERYCRLCPVRVNCLASALRNNDVGIFAGTTTDDRKKIKRVRNRSKCPQCRHGEMISLGVHDICTACGTSWKTERRTEKP